MINNCKAFFLFLSFCSIAILACDQDDDVSPNSNDPQAVSSVLASDNEWIITLFTDDGENETYYFESYRFNFDLDGSVVATGNNDIVTGTYSVFRDDGRVELKMSFPNIQYFDELNDDWYFISMDQNVVRFDDDGDRLEFQKQ
ncbi:MAG: hypothetical protein R2795_18920 [Saprospiraceae bacterium]